MEIVERQRNDVSCQFIIVAAYPAVYGQFPQAIPQPMAAVAPQQREGKSNIDQMRIKKKHQHR